MKWRYARSGDERIGLAGKDEMASFGEVLLTAVKYLYTDAEHSVVSNRVGTPFSCIFYNLLMKNLAAILRTF